MLAVRPHATRPGKRMACERANAHLARDPVSPTWGGCCAGIVGMCKEHFGVALALKVPVFFVVTKVDICPEHVLQHTLASLQAILRKPGVKKKPFMVSCQPPECLAVNSTLWGGLM